MRHGTLDRFDYAKDWRGRCSTCHVESRQSDARCPGCKKAGSLVYFKESRSYTDRNGLGCVLAKAKWTDCGWRCLNCGARLKSLPCRNGHDSIPLHYTLAYLRTPCFEWLAIPAGILAASITYAAGVLAFGNHYFLIAALLVFKVVLRQCKPSTMMWQTNWN